MHITDNKGMIYILSIVPFFLNDFSNINSIDYERWVLIDYACRIGVLAFLGVMVLSKKLSWVELGVSFHRKDRIILWTLFLSVMAFLYYALSSLWLAPFDAVGMVSKVAYDRQSLLFWVDMTFGLGLVAVSEELIARGLALAALRELTENKAVILLVSSLVFALFHWSTGLKNIIDCFAYGCLFMGVTMRTKSIIPACVVHFGVNYSLLA